MRIGLVSGVMKDNDITYQVSQIESYISKYNSYDLLCFGESYLQGFEGLSWSYEEDLKRALSQDDPIIMYLRSLANKYKCGLSFGFIEKESSKLYSSNMVIDKEGSIIDVFRRVSTGWKEPNVSPMYQEGIDFHTFTYMNKTLTTAICGDLWDDIFLTDLCKLDVDAVLWPFYIDFSVNEWNRQYLNEYTVRVKEISSPILMINSFVEETHRANGGCYIFDKGRVALELPMGNTGVLEFVI